MTYEQIADTLFVEISVFTTLLTAFMLYNNIVLYKMSFKDKLSIMLVSATVLSAFDGIWHFVDGNLTYKILNYACAYIFAIAMMLGTSMFTRFSLNQFGLKMSSKKIALRAIYRTHRPYRYFMSNDTLDRSSIRHRRTWGNSIWHHL